MMLLSKLYLMRESCYYIFNWNYDFEWKDGKFRIIVYSCSSFYNFRGYLSFFGGYLNNLEGGFLNY